MDKEMTEPEPIAITPVDGETEAISPELAADPKFQHMLRSMMAMRPTHRLDGEKDRGQREGEYHIYVRPGTAQAAGKLEHDMRMTALSHPATVAEWTRMIYAIPVSMRTPELATFLENLLEKARQYEDAMSKYVTVEKA